MSQTHKWSHISTLTLIFLTPLFFIPGGALALGSTKSALFCLGIVVTSLLYIYEAWKEGSIHLPKSYFVLAAVLLPVVYLLSALLSTPSSLSLLGYNLEGGTFAYLVLGSSALLLASLIFSNTTRSLQALVALFASFSILTLFMVVKILSKGSILVLGNFSGNMGNPLGSWTDLSMAFGLLAVFSALAIGMIPMKRGIKALLYGVFALSALLLIVLGFSTAIGLTLAASVIVYLYLWKIERDFMYSKDESASRSIGNFFTRATFLPILLIVVSLIFLVNPNISEEKGRLSNVVSSAFGVENSDVRPTLSATLDISKAVLSQVALLGSGPNTFRQDWLIFKPASVNATPFWGVAFPLGVGFLPTQIATTGIMGSALWLAFLLLIIGLSIKVIGKIPEARASRFVLVATMLISLFLWVASLFYSPSDAMLLLAFIFAGLFVASAREAGTLSDIHVNLRGASHVSLASHLILAIVVVGMLSLGWVGAKKTLADYHFKKAVDLANTEGSAIGDVEKELDKALMLAPVDSHYMAVSRINFAKAQAAASSATGTPEQNQAKFQDALSKSIQAARSAVSVNPASYENWVNLGLIYTSLVPEPLKVEGSYENAQFAYSEALKRNPNSPEVVLLLARLELAKGNTDNARSYLRRSIALKEDYADAYLALAQLEMQQNNLPAAIASTQALVTLLPNNSGLHFELGLLRYSNKDFTGAVESLERALTLSPDYANAKFYLALSYKELNRIIEARALLQDLVASNPDSAELKTALSELDK